MNIKLIHTPADYYTFLDVLNSASVVGFDTEGTSLDPYTNKLLLCQFHINGDSYVLDFTRLDHKLISLLKGTLEDPNVCIVGHNLSYDWKIMYHVAKIEITNIHDTMIAERMLQAGLKMRHSLKDVVNRRLNITIDKDIRDTFIGLEDTKELLFSEEQISYAGWDAYYPIAIREQQLAEIEQKELQRIYTLEMNIIPPTAMMEYTGVPINKSLLEAMVSPFEHFVASADRALQDLFISAGAAESILFTADGYYAINTASGDQMKEALARVGINITGKGGKTSLDSKDVARWDAKQRNKKEHNYHDLVDDDEVADALDQYVGINNHYLRAFTFLQGARKLLATYIYGLLAAINTVTGRVHPHFNSYGAEATGRYSSNGPKILGIIAVMRY